MEREEYRKFEAERLVYESSPEAGGGKGADAPKDAKPPVPEVKPPKVDIGVAEDFDYSTLGVTPAAGNAEQFAKAKKERIDKQKETLAGTKELASVVPIEHPEFEAQRREAKTKLKQIALDSMPGVNSPEELALQAELEKDLELKFDKFEEAYVARLSDLASTGEKAEKIKEDFKQAAKDFVFRTELTVYQKNIEKNDQDSKSTKLHILEKFMKTKGYPPQFAPFLIEGNDGLLSTLKLSGDGNFPKNEEELNQRLEELCSPDKIKAAIRKMIDMTPRFVEPVDDENGVDFAMPKEHGQEEEYFERLINKTDGVRGSLMETVGRENVGDVKRILAKRFAVEFNGAGSANHVVDLMASRSPFVLSNEAGNKAFYSYLLNLCKTDLAPDKDKKAAEEAIDEKADEQKAQFKEMIKGTWGPFKVGKISDLASLEGNDDAIKLMTDTTKYQNFIGAGIKKGIGDIRAMSKENGNPRELQGLVEGLSEQNVRGIDSLGEHLTDLLRLIQGFFGAKNKELISDFTKDIANGQDPVKNYTEAQGNYQKFLEKVDPKPAFAELVKGGLDPKGTEAEGLFAKGRAKDKDAQALDVSKYKGERTNAVRAYLGAIVGDSAVELKKKDDKPMLLFNKDGARYSLVAKADGAMELTPEPMPEKADAKALTKTVPKFDAESIAAAVADIQKALVGAPAEVALTAEQIKEGYLKILKSDAIIFGKKDNYGLLKKIFDIDEYKPKLEEFRTEATKQATVRKKLNGPLATQKFKTMAVEYFMKPENFDAFRKNIQGDPNLKTAFKAAEEKPAESQKLDPVISKYKEILNKPETVFGNTANPGLLKKIMDKFPEKSQEIVNRTQPKKGAKASVKAAAAQKYKAMAIEFLIDPANFEAFRTKAKTMDEFKPIEEALAKEAVPPTPKLPS